MITQNEFNIIYEFLDRVPLKGHNERAAMNSVIIKLQKNTVYDNPGDNKERRAPED